MMRWANTNSLMNDYGQATWQQSQVLGKQAGNFHPRVARRKCASRSQLGRSGERDVSPSGRLKADEQPFKGLVIEQRDQQRGSNCIRELTAKKMD